MSVCLSDTWESDRCQPGRMLADGAVGHAPGLRTPPPTLRRGVKWAIPRLWTQFPHLGIFHSQPESITDCMLKQVQNPEEVQYIEKRLPLVYKIREQKAVKNHFPFSTHDNRHCLQNVGEYFDFSLGRKKVEPERRQQNSQNFCLWAHEYIPNSHDGFTIYQTSFIGDQDTKRPFCRRYPKQHLERCYIYKSIPENEKHM
ncbi:testis-expressed protein 36 isoform X2 [Malaclemys terrapin pileata]|uniref:testis-expressed protein 36 isoform X2 n=1 Tax=Malaclemys terrapin pileata TaxID=2991368 RepID=UPI0023A89CC1|nr:testis-expressed protein 36 isoform X2 [Malaclemys terrapin pileata]